MNLNEYRYDKKTKLDLKDIPTGPPKDAPSKAASKQRLEENIAVLADLQNKLYAQNKAALLLIFQAMDAAGKDSMIRRVLSGLNPQGTQVFSFKQPSQEELDHDYLWAAHQRMPERGRIGVFNRSYYEEVLIVRVHNLLKTRNLPQSAVHENVWDARLAHIAGFEDYLSANGILLLKFYLHISKQEQMRRFRERLDDPSKNWKFSAADLREREYWDDYRFCYEEAIEKTASKAAPWYVIPSDDKWYSRVVVSEIIMERMKSLNLAYPVLDKEQLQRIEQCKEDLKCEEEKAEKD